MDINSSNHCELLKASPIYQIVSIVCIFYMLYHSPKCPLSILTSVSILSLNTTRKKLSLLLVEERDVAHIGEIWNASERV